MMDMHLNIVQEVALAFLDGLSLLDCLTHLFHVLGHLIPSQLSHLVSARLDQVEKDPKTRYHDAKNKFRGKEPDLLVLILLDNNGSLYGCTRWRVQGEVVDGGVAMGKALELRWTESAVRWTKLLTSNMEREPEASMEMRVQGKGRRLGEHRKRGR
ncbi:hypothetical protein ACSQ67_000963 [Phaseolus vulgaris]